MGKTSATLGLLTPSLLLLVFAPSALAGPPTHLLEPDRGLVGAAPDPGPTHPVQPFNHACGTAVDSKGDVYVASAGNDTIDVFNAAHEYLTSIANANEPCGLAVDGNGQLYVSEKAKGEVVRYVPNLYPFAGTPTYGAPVEIDKSTKAKGIAVDPHDGRLYVAEGNHIAVYKSDGSFEANLGEADGLKNATGVAAYSYVISKNILEERASRYLYVADDGASKDEVKVFSGIVLDPTKAAIAAPKLRRTLTGPKEGVDFGFGAAGAYLAVDPGNRSETDKCKEEALEPQQACTAGYFLVYDDAHKAVEEFDATGEFLDQFTNEVLADAKPTAMAVERSAGPNDGTIYVTSGDGAGAKLLAFGPLVPPSRPISKDLSKEKLENTGAVATDPYGDVYATEGAFVHVYAPDGKELKELVKFKDDNVPLNDLAVDSECNVYVLEKEERVVYYEASACPPVSGTSFTRHEPPIATKADFAEPLRAIAVNPGPENEDHVFVTAAFKTHEYDTAKNDSELLEGKFAEGVGNRLSIAVHGASGNVYFGVNAGPIAIVSKAGELVSQINGAGCPKGPLSPNPHIAVDQSNGHVLSFDVGEANANPEKKVSVREYDASGACIGEFGKFSGVGGGYRLAVDPTSGTVYLAFADQDIENPYDLTAFGPLSYGDKPLAVTGMASSVGGGAATLNGTVNPNGFKLAECVFEYLTEDEYLINGKTFVGAEKAACEDPDATDIGGKEPVAVHAGVSGLLAEGRYRFRLVARNKYGESIGEPPGTFGPPVLITKEALPLYDESTLRANIDPSGLQTEYHFDYGIEEGELDQSTPIRELPPGAGKTDTETTLVGLKEGTTYYYRIFVENEAKEVIGTEQEFTTQKRVPSLHCPNAEYRTGFSANLPDCRAYELVTPAATNGLSPEAAAVDSTGFGFSDWLITPRGAGAGESLAYFTDGTLPGFDGNGRTSGYRAQRAPGDHPTGGWSSEIFSPSYLESAPGLSETSAQRGVSSDQRYSFWQIRPEDSFPETLPKGIYLRTPGAEESECPGSQGHFEPVGCGSLDIDLTALSRYVSAGGDHVLFTSKAQLEPVAPAPGTTALYDRAAGKASAQVVSLEPGDVSAFGTDATYVASTEDGEAILFKVANALYLRRGGETIQITESSSTFAGLSEDGERVFYAKGASGNAPATLFVCDIDAVPCGDQGTQIAEDSIFINVPADGSGAFFTSEEALTGGEENENGEVAEVGERNLYAWDLATEATSFIAVLDADDFDSFGGQLLMDLSQWTAAIGPGGERAKSPTRSTPGGEVLLFQSHARLGAYDNEGVGEIYRYEPAAAAGERLLCVSCDPGKGSPSADAMLQDPRPTTGMNEETIVANLTDDGEEAFFSSPDRLLPEDANGVGDVYRWQASEAPGCKRPGGCLGLISSGQGETASILYSVSPDGDDVFFRTLEKLLGADVTGSRSIYDARRNGGIPEAPEPPICTGDACQGNGSSPPTLPPAATAGGESGNLTSSPARPCAKGKRRVKGKGRCVKKHQGKGRHRQKHRRAPR